ncbi:hypothetical protein LCGC14_2078020, partial [marine sediment metagenome]
CIDTAINYNPPAAPVSILTIIFLGLSLGECAEAGARGQVPFSKKRGQGNIKALAPFEASSSLLYSHSLPVTNLKPLKMLLISPFFSAESIHHET